MKRARHFGAGYSYFGEDYSAGPTGAKGMDVKAFGDSSGKYVFWDASADTLYVAGTLDVDGAITVGVNDTGYDVTFFGATSGKKFFWDESADTAYLTCTVDIDGTVTVGVDDTGYDVKFFGATSGKYALWDESADTLILSGVIQVGTVATAALALGLGVSATPLTTATADKNFLGSYTQSTATSGDSRGAYIKHILGGTIAATGFGDAVRALCSVTGTGYSYASGLHATMSLAASATITGSGAGLRCTLEAAADTRTLPGNIAALQIDSNIATGNTVPSNAALIRVCKAGAVDVATFLHVEDDQCLKGSAATGAATNALPVLMPDGSTLYISLIAAS